MKRLLVVVPAVVLLLAGCTGEEPRSAPTATPSTAATSPSPPTPEEVVHDPGATLMNVRVAGTRGHRTVASSWLLGRKRALVHSDDGFATARYERYTQERAEELMPPGHRFLHPERLGLGGLMAWPVPWIGRPRLAVLGGSDGATLFPFEKVARFADGRWTAYDQPEVDGERAYAAGAVVLPDGRLLVLLDHWSGDRAGRPSDIWHGLWVSDGADWTSFRPHHPDFDPRPPATSAWSPFVGLGGSGGRDGLMWLMTADSRVYTSEDGAAFREIRVR